MGYEFSVLKPLHHEGVYWTHRQLGHNTGLVVCSSSEFTGAFITNKIIFILFSSIFFNFISLNIYLKTTIYILILAFYSFSVLIFNKQFYYMHVFCQYFYDFILIIVCCVMLHFRPSAAEDDNLHRDYWRCVCPFNPWQTK